MDHLYLDTLRQTEMIYVVSCSENTTICRCCNSLICSPDFCSSIWIDNRCCVMISSSLSFWLFYAFLNTRFNCINGLFVVYFLVKEINQILERRILGALLCRAVLFLCSNAKIVHCRLLLLFTIVVDQKKEIMNWMNKYICNIPSFLKFWERTKSHWRYMLIT